MELDVPRENMLLDLKEYRGVFLFAFLMDWLIDDRDDILDDSKSGTRTDRLVKWINRRNVRRRHAKKEMRQTTERVLGQPSVDDARLKNVQKLVMRSSSCDDSSRLSHPLTHQPSAQWECISDMGEIELCAMNSSVAEGEESFRMDTSTRDKFMPAVQESVSGSHSLDETSQSDDAKGVSVYV